MVHTHRAIIESNRSHRAIVESNRSVRTLLNAIASQGGGDRSAISTIAKKSQSRSSSLGAAYANSWAERHAERDALVGMRVNIPASHGNKYGYATKGTVLVSSR